MVQYNAHCTAVSHHVAGFHDVSPQLSDLRCYNMVISNVSVSCTEFQFSPVYPLALGRTEVVKLRPKHQSYKRWS